MSPPKKPSRRPRIGSKGDFPGPLFLAVAPVEVEWPQRQELARATGANTEINYDTLLRVCGGGNFAELPPSLPVRLGG